MHNTQTTPKPVLLSLLCLGVSVLACKGEEKAQAPNQNTNTTTAVAISHTSPPVETAPKLTPEQEVRALLEGGKTEVAIQHFYTIPGAIKDPTWSDLRKDLDLAWVAWMKETRLEELAADKRLDALGEIIVTLEEWSAYEEKFKAKGIALHVPEEIKSYKEWPAIKAILKQTPRKKLLAARKDFDKAETAQALAKLLCPQEKKECQWVTTEELVDAFHANELKAEKTYGEGSYIFIQGEVERVRKAALGQVAIELKPPKKHALSLPVQAYIVGEENQDFAAKLSPKNNILLECGGGVSKSMHLLVRECRFTKQKDLPGALLRAMVTLLPFTPPPSHMFALSNK